MVEGCPMTTEEIFMTLLGIFFVYVNYYGMDEK